MNPLANGAIQNRVSDAGRGPVLGRYELLMRIASGGMATVWAARLRGTRGFQKIVALKTILPALSADPAHQRLFLEEARLAGQIRHPNVAQILDLGEDNGVLYLAMEWVDGVSLSELLRAAQAIGVAVPLSVAIRIATQIAAGLHAAHELRDDNDDLIGLIHRDVSPQNILVSFDGVAKVIDFGMAKAANPDETSRSIQLMGKVGYLAPEQIVNAATDRGIDIFSLGVVLYLLTTGVHPFEGSVPLATLYNIGCDDPVRLPSSFRSDYPNELESIVLRCLEKERSRRFATCDELVWALESSIPPDLRATDQDVAVFVRSLAGDIGAERHRPLRLSTVDGEGYASVSHLRIGERRDDPSCTLVDGDAMPRTGTLPDASLAAEPQPASAHYRLVLWGAVLAVSIWILVLQTRGSFSPPSTHGPSLPRIHLSDSACPPPFAGLSPDVMLSGSVDESSTTSDENRDEEPKLALAQPRPRKSTSKERPPAGVAKASSKRKP